MNRRISLTILSSLLFMTWPAGGRAGERPAADPELTRQAGALVEAYQKAYRSMNVDEVLKLFSPDLENAKREVYRAFFEMRFERGFSEVEASPGAVKETPSGAAIRVSLIVHYRRPDGGVDRRPENHILFAERDGERWLLLGAAEEFAGAEYDPKTRTYRSDVGRYTINLPAGWTPIEAPLELGAITADSICFLAPDMESTCILGFVKLPIRMRAEDAVRADEAATKRLTSSHRILDEGPWAWGDGDGYLTISEFSEKPPAPDQQPAKDGTIRRMRVYLSGGLMLYFFIFDVSPPDRFDALRPQFDSMVRSFAAIPPEEGERTEDAVAEKLAQGAILERVYTNKEFNCFIAAPEGWEINTSPNPAHLVEMRYQQGKSIARLLAVKGLPSDPGMLKTTFEQRLETVKEIVENFRELSRREVTARGVPAIESVQTYSLEGIGKFGVKELTIVRDGTYYLILCQAIEPDAYGKMEPDFDRIIQSFGFIQ